MLNREVVKEFLDKELQEIEIPDNILKKHLWKLSFVETGDGSLFLFCLSETLYLQGFQTPFRNALKTHVECL